MDLNLEILSDNLPEEIGGTRLGRTRRERSLRYAQLYSGNEPLRSDVLYVCDSGDLPRDTPRRPVSLICCGEKPGAEWISSSEILYVASGSPSALLGEIGRLFYRFNSWERRILEETSRVADFSLETILRLGAEVLENPLNVTNSTMISLFEMRLQPDSSDVGFSIEIDKPNRPIDVFPMERLIPAYKAEREIRTPYLAQTVVDGIHTYCSNIFLMERLVGCVFMQEKHRPFRKSDLMVADCFFKLFSTAFLKYIQTSPAAVSGRALALQRLVFGASLDKKAFDDVEPSTRYRCLLLRCKDELDSIPPETVAATLNALLAESCTAIARGTEVVALYETCPGLADDMPYIADLCETMEWMAFASSEFSQIEHLPVFLRFAEYTADCAGSRPGYGIACFDDYAVDYIIGRYSGDFPPGLLFPQGFNGLVSHDAESSISYIETLATVLDCRMNVSQAAAKLYLHRSSLVYRLDHIKRILGMDLGDPKTRLLLQLCINLLSQEELS